MFSFSHPAFDSDQHYYETLDAFTRHLPAAWKARTVQEVVIDGRVRFIVGGRLHTSVRNPTFNPIVKPGAMADYFRGNPERKELVEFLADREPCPDYYREPDARIRKLDEQGLAGAWLLPSLGMAYEEELQHDPHAAAAAFRAFNRWVDEDWGFAYKNRLFAAAYLAMGDREAAVAEVEWSLDNGARLFVVRPSGVFTESGWKSPGDAWFDPIWARINEARATVIVHVAEVGGHGLDRFLPHKKDLMTDAVPPMQIVVGHERPIANYMAALVCDRLFERFPNLRVASVENGAEFLVLLMRGLRRAEFQRPGYFKDPPLETFRQHVWVAPFWEDDLAEAVDLIGADRVLFGSDWPHPEGLPEPRHYDKVVAELDDQAAEGMIMYRNAAELTGLP